MQCVTRVIIKQKWGTIGPTYLSREHCDAPPPSFLFYLGVSLLYLINRQSLQQIDLVYGYNSVEWPLRSFKFQIETMRNFKVDICFSSKTTNYTVW